MATSPRKFNWLSPFLSLSSVVTAASIASNLFAKPCDTGHSMFSKSLTIVRNKVEDPEVSVMVRRTRQLEPGNGGSRGLAAAESYERIIGVGYRTCIDTFKFIEFWPIRPIEEASEC